MDLAGCLSFPEKMDELDQGKPVCDLQRSFILVNIPIYWIAIYKSPHYLLFLLPLLFTVLTYAWESTSRKDLRHRIFYFVIGIAIVLGFGIACYLPFSSWVNQIQFVQLKAGVLAFGFVTLLIFYLKNKIQYLFSLVGILVLLRLAFNWFVIPQRIEDQMVYPRLSSRIQDIIENEPVQILASYPAGFYDRITFPLELRRKQILTMANDIQFDHFYLVDDYYLQQYPHSLYLSFPFDYMDKNLRYKGNMHLIKIEP